jgi:DNA-directed RNA polymerase subunit RPC12/RpoP
MSQRKITTDWEKIVYLEASCPHCNNDVIRANFEDGEGSIVKCLICQKEFELGKID